MNQTTRNRAFSLCFFFLIFKLKGNSNIQRKIFPISEYFQYKNLSISLIYYIFYLMDSYLNE